MYTHCCEQCNRIRLIETKKQLMINNDLFTQSRLVRKTIISGREATCEYAAKHFNITIPLWYCNAAWNTLSTLSYQHSLLQCKDVINITCSKLIIIKLIRWFIVANNRHYNVSGTLICVGATELFWLMQVNTFLNICSSSYPLMWCSFNPKHLKIFKFFITGPFFSLKVPNEK